MADEILSPVETRFWAKVQKTQDCWIWTASKSRDGYGRFYFDGCMRGSHRFAYRLLVGEVPAGFQLDHLCRNRLCCRPEHLECVTSQENTSRGNAGENMRSKTHCKHGHEFTTENTIVRGNGKWRKCRTCARRAGRENKRRRYGYKARNTNPGGEPGDSGWPDLAVRSSGLTA